MLSKASQIQTDKSHMFSLICGRQIQKINVNTNYKHVYICIYVHIYDMFIIVGQFEGTRERRVKGEEM
jgi:hypothetical protein